MKITLTDMESFHKWLRLRYPIRRSLYRPIEVLPYETVKVDGDITIYIFDEHHYAVEDSYKDSVAIISLSEEDDIIESFRLLEKLVQVLRNRFTRLPVGAPDVVSNG